MSRDATPADVIAGRARWCVVEGERDALIAALGTDSVDVTITDPPYNARTHNGARARGGKLERVTTVRFAELDGFAWWCESLRVTRRWCLAFCAPEQLGAYESSAGARWVRSGVWVRLGAAPQFTGDRPAAGADAIAIAHREGRKRWNGGGEAAVWSYGFGTDEVGASRVHETQKPLALMRRLVRLFSDPGEVIWTRTRAAAPRALRPCWRGVASSSWSATRSTQRRVDRGLRRQSPAKDRGAQSKSISSGAANEHRG